jgi:multiple sugar transport system permease protein
MKLLSRIAAGIAAAFATIIVLGPMVWAVSTSLKPTDRIFEVPPRLIPEQITFDHYRRLITEGVHWSFLNSSLYSGLAVIIALVLGSIAGYALARFPIPQKRLVQAIVVGALAVPGFAVLLPTQILFMNMGLHNTHLALPILYGAYAVPFALWMTQAHFASIPRELEYAAMVDGYSRAEAVWKVVLPGAKPALIAAATVAFLHAWNDYVTAVTMTDSPGLRTMPVALIFYQGFLGRDWGALMAGVVIATIPPIVVFLLFRRYLIGGYSEGAIKG